MKNLRAIYYIFFFCFFAGVNIAIGQGSNISLNAYNGGYPQMTTYQDMTQGKTKTNQVTIQIQKWSGANNVNYWKLTARLVTDFTNTQNSSQTIGAQYSQLGFNEEANYGSSNPAPINPPNTPVTLSKYNEVTLLESSVPLPTRVNRVLKYNLTILGGTHLLIVPNGQYNAAYEFKLYGRATAGGSYTLVNTITTGTNGSGVQINYTGNYGTQSVTLQNSANLINMEYATTNDYLNGRSVLIQNGLKVTTYNTYQLMVKSSNSVFTSSETSNTYPISVLHLEASMDPPESNVQFHGPLTVSTADQTLITRSSTNPQTLEYNIRFFTLPNAFGPYIEEGTYSAFVYFTIAPN